MKFLIASFVALLLCLNSFAEPDRNIPSECGLAEAAEDFEYTPALKFCAEAGNSEAKTWLAIIYLGKATSHLDAEDLRELSLPENLTAADLEQLGKALMREAADEGDPAAQNELGIMLLDGDFSTSIDVPAAIFWLEKAAAQQEQLALLTLAKLNAEGKVVPFDASKAITFFERSVEAENEISICVNMYWNTYTADEKSEDQLLNMIANAYDYQFPTDPIFPIIGKFSDYAQSNFVHQISVSAETERRLSSATPADQRSCQVVRNLFPANDSDEGYKYFINPVSFTVNSEARWNENGSQPTKLAFSTVRRLRRS